MSTDIKTRLEAAKAADKKEFTDLMNKLVETGATPSYIKDTANTRFASLVDEGTMTLFAYYEMLEQANEQNSELVKQLDAIVTENLELQDEVLALQDSEEKLAKELDEAGEEVADWTTRYASLDKETTARHQALVSGHEQLASRYIALKVELAVAQRQIESLRARLARAEQIELGEG